MMKVYNNLHICKITMHPKKKKTSTLLLPDLKVRVFYKKKFPMVINVSKTVLVVLIPTCQILSSSNTSIDMSEVCK